MAEPVALPTPVVDARLLARDTTPGFVVSWGDNVHLSVLSFGLACCAVEFVAASLAAHDLVELGLVAAPDAPQRHELVVVSGTLTDAMAPEVARVYASLTGPRHVISFGSCASSGGPYWDSYSVTKGVDQILPVDVYVPGCPPRPEALLDAVARLLAPGGAA